MNLTAEWQHQCAAIFDNPVLRRDLISLALGRTQPTAEHRLLHLQPTAKILRELMQVCFENEKQVAVRLNISVKTLQNARWRGFGPPFCHPMGAASRSVRYNVLELNAWLAKNQFSSTSQVSLLRDQCNG